MCEYFHYSTHCTFKDINHTFLHKICFLYPGQEFSNNIWGKEQSGNGVVVPARPSTYPGGIDSLESILGLLKVKYSGSVYCTFYKAFSHEVIM